MVMNSGIYHIKNTKTNKVYIGSAVNFKKRFNVHLSDLRNGKHHSSILQRSFNKHGESCFEFVVLAKCPIEYLLSMEQKFIDVFKPYYNVCKSVTKGRLGLKNSIKHIASLRAANIGKPCKESTKQKLREHNKGKLCSKEIKEKLKNHSSRHPIDQFDINGKLVKTHKSIREASRQVGVDNRVIRKCLAGEYKLAAGFIWKKHGEVPTKTEIQERTNHSNKKRAVLQIDNGKTVQRHESIQEAARNTNLNPRKICSCCQGKFKHYKGYEWKYEI